MNQDPSSLPNRILRLVRVLLARLMGGLERFGSKSVARELADSDDTPKLSGALIVRLIARSVPFMRPMLFHIILMFCFGLVLTVLWTFTGAVSSDMWDNKMLINDKLQPAQAFLILVDETYVREEFLDDEAKARVAAAGFSGEDLTELQRKTVRNRMMVWFLIGVIFQTLVTMFFRYYGLWVWQNVNQNLRVAMIEKLEYLSLTFHQSHRSGDAIYRIYQDSSMIVNVLQQCVIGPFETLRDMTFAMAFLMAFDWRLGMAVFVSLVPMFVITALATPKIRQLSVANRVANSDFTSRLQETFACLKVVKASQAEAIMVQRFDVDSQYALDRALYLRFGMVLLSLAVGVMGALVVIGLEYLIVSWVVEARETNFPTWATMFVGFAVWNYAAFNQANGRIGQISGEGRGLVRLWCMLQDLFIGLERAFYFLDLKPMVVDPPHPKEFPNQVTSVAWKDVEFHYDSNAQVLSGASLSAQAGTITAIVGSTGSGKSTLMALLLRLYDPQEGSVCINNTSVREFSIDNMRTHCAIALQKNVLFTGTIKENIAYATNNVSDDEVARAAQIACIEDFIESLEKRYDTRLGERGSKLSSGQRQRLTIARAVIRNTPILILDEPTASLDAETEQRVLANLSEWGHDKIVFIITHRISTIRNADPIAFLEDGKIVEVGAHDDLMNVPRGHYRRFVDAEHKGLEDGVA